MISITQDEGIDCDDDNDCAGPDINDVHTDLEDIDSDNEQRPLSPCRKKSLKLKRRPSKNLSDAGTDIENYNDSDSDDDDELNQSIKYSGQFSINEFLDHGCVQEATNAHDTVQHKTGLQSRQKPTSLWYVHDGGVDGGVTDCENLETSDNEMVTAGEATSPNYDHLIINLPAEMNTISIHDSVDAKKSNRSSRSKTPASSDSESDRSRSPWGKTKHHKRTQFPASDVENIMFTDDEDPMFSGGKIKLNPSMLDGEMICIEISDTDELVQPRKDAEIRVSFAQPRAKCASTRRKKNRTAITGSHLFVQIDAADGGHTDVENLNSSDDDDDDENEPLASSFLIPVAIVHGDALTDIEDFDDDDECVATKVYDIKMPSPVRELTITKESATGSPISRTMPMSSSQFLGLQENYIDKGLTDTEEMSGKEDDYCDTARYVIDKMPENIDGGITHNCESVKSPKTRRVEMSCGADHEPITDVEELNMDGATLRRKKSKTKNTTSYKGKKFLDTRMVVDKPATDMEELYMSDDNQTTKTKASKTQRISLLLTEPVPDDFGGKTDVEDLSDDDDDIDADVQTVKCSDIDSSVFTNEAFFSTITSRDNCSKTKSSKHHKISQPIIRKISPTPDIYPTTDIEDMQDTDDNLGVDTSYSRANTVTPVDFQRTLNEVCQFTVHDQSNSRFDCERESKGQREYQDIATDTEFFEDDANNAQNIQSDTESNDIQP